MARMTFSDLTQQSKDICISDQSVSYTGMTDDLTFIKREVNNAVSDIFSLIKEYRLEPTPKTLQTEADVTYYSYPPGLMKPTSFTIELNVQTPELKIVQSQQEWNSLTQIAITSGFPTHVFPRRDDFGIYPTPSGAYTVTIVGNYQPVNMSQDDYTSGVVTATLNDKTITTSGSFTQAMVNRWFVLTDSTSLVPTGNWYRIAEYTTPSSIELSRAFTESSVQGATYRVGESPELPEELHQYIPYKVGAVYFHVRRHEPVRAQELLNYFYTGDFRNEKRSGNMKNGVLSVLNDLKNKGRGNTNLIETGGLDAGSNFIENTPWNTVLS